MGPLPEKKVSIERTFSGSVKKNVKAFHAAGAAILLLYVGFCVSRNLSA